MKISCSKFPYYIDNLDRWLLDNMLIFQSNKFMCTKENPCHLFSIAYCDMIFQIIFETFGFKDRPWCFHNMVLQNLCFALICSYFVRKEFCKFIECSINNFWITTWNPFFCRCKNQLQHRLVWIVIFLPWFTVNHAPI